MGDHYTPEYYLKGFTDQRGKIYTYDKLTSSKFCTGVNNVGHETGFYSREMETYLANVIEGPANSVISKIRNKQIISIAEKEILTRYMVALLKRVPEGRQRFEKMGPHVAEETFEEFKTALTKMQFPDNIKQEYLERAEQFLGRYATNPPKDIWLNSIPPETSPTVLLAVTQMTWVFLTSDRTDTFLTSDNPMFFFESLGLGNPDSEISFPLSSKLVLWATWRKDFSDCDYLAIKAHAIKEINRRTAFNASRYIFSASDEQWIPDFIKKHHKLNLMKG
jgi:hypothetical protein